MLRRVVLTLFTGTGWLVVAAAPVHGDTSTVLASSPWPMYGHDVKHTFRTTLVGPTVANLLPTTQLPNKITSQPTVGPDGTIVVDLGFSVFGIRADGTVLWQSPLSSDAKFSAATIDSSGSFYVGDRGNSFLKYDLETGDRICRYYIHQDGDIRGSPTISVQFPDRAYVPEAGVAGGLWALGTQSGNQCQVVWTLAPSVVPGGSASSISLADSSPGSGDSKGLLIYAAGRSIYAIQDNGTGAAVKFSRNLGATIQVSTPTIDPATGKIFIGTLGKTFFAMNPSDFSDVFAPRTLDSPIQTTAGLSPDGDTVYVLTSKGTIYALDTTTGADEPGFPMPIAKNTFREPNAPSIDGNGNIYVAGSDRHVRGLHPDGTVFFDSVVGMSVTTPVTIVNGGLIVADLGGNLYRFCPDPTGPPTAEKVCGFTVDTTVGPSPTPTRAPTPTPSGAPTPTPITTPTPTPRPTPTSTSSPRPTPTSTSPTPSPTSTANVFNDASLFAAQQFLDFFGRPGSPSGISFWASQINGSILTRAQVIDDFYLAAGFQNVFPPIARLFFAYFNRIPDFAGVEFWIGQLKGGAPLASISQAFATSSEFQSIYGTVDDPTFVGIVYQNTLGRPPTTSEKTNAVNQLAQGTSRGALMVSFSEASQFRTSSANEVFVTAIYVSMLRRSPTRAELRAGLNSLDSGSTQTDLINALLNSAEYHDRF